MRGGSLVGIAEARSKLSLLQCGGRCVRAPQILLMASIVEDEFAVAHDLVLAVGVAEPDAEVEADDVEVGG